MRVLLIHNDYARPSGEEHAIQSIARLLQPNGHTVQWFRRSSAEIAGVAGKAKAFFAGVYNPSSRLAIRRLLDAERVDVAQVQNLYPLLSPSVLSACRGRCVPVVMRCPNYRLFCPNGLHLSHGEICERCVGGREYWCVFRDCEGDVLKSLGYALRNVTARLTHSITRNVDVFIVLSQFQKQRFVAAGLPEASIEILPNVVPAVGADGPDGPGDLVTYCGRVSLEKGIGDFLEAARALPKLPFCVAGGYDPDSAWYRNSPPNVQWCGFLGEDDLNRLYRQSRMLVFPSKWFEGFPNVVTRAMALARPVIASRLGALPEIVEDRKTGLLFEAGNVADLVRRIRALYANPGLCASLGRNGREKAEREYSESVVYARLMEIYEKAIRINEARRQSRPPRQVH